MTYRDEDYASGLGNRIIEGAEDYASGLEGITYDADAQAFFTAAGITDGAQKDAVNDLVVGLKADSLWAKMKAIYPFVGGTAATHKFNLKDPRDLDAAFRLVFAGTWVHSATGVKPDGTTGYATTQLSPDALGQYNCGMSLYSRTNDATPSTVGIDIGYSGATQFYMRLRESGGGLTSSSLGANGGSGFVDANAMGFYTTVRSSSTNRRIYKNGVLQLTDATANTDVLPSGNITLGQAASLYTNRDYAMMMIHTNLSDTEAANLYTRVLTFQTALSRAVI